MIKIGHRGAPRVAPANTMASFHAAHALGCDWVECDCRASSDGIIVLAHDEEVTDARTGRVYSVERHPAAHLAALDLGAGEGVPTLEDLVAWAVGRVGVMADVKRGGFEREIGAALEPLTNDRKIVPGADEAGRHRFRALFPDLPISLTLNRHQSEGLDDVLKTLDTQGVTFEYPLVTPARIRLLQARGIRVFAWTVDDLDTMQALAAMGVDGIISNRADLLQEVTPQRP